MPMPRRSSVDDFFAQLNDVQRPHLEALRKLSLDADPEAREELKWNLPVYVRGDKTSLWMLQNFKHHCSLRFPPPFFATEWGCGPVANERNGGENNACAWTDAACAVPSTVPRPSFEPAATHSH